MRKSAKLEATARALDFRGRRKRSTVNISWWLGLVVAALAVAYGLLRLRRRRLPPARDDAPPVPVPHSRPTALDLDPVDDTAPAVLSPPEWQDPDRKVSNSSRDREK